MLIREALEELLQCAQEQLTMPVCQSFWNPGGNAPFDSCEETTQVIDGELVTASGQLWVGHITDAAGWPAQTTNPITCATPFAVTIELGIVRCAKGKLQDVDLLPDPDLITQDAQQQEEDRVALKNAILCCWGISGRDMLPPIWEPIEPRGGCVGGTWTVVVRDATCLCHVEES